MYLFQVKPGKIHLMNGRDGSILKQGRKDNPNQNSLGFDVNNIEFTGNDILSVSCGLLVPLSTISAFCKLS